MGMVRYLQGWIGVVGLMALGNTISCFRGHDFLSERLYTEATAEVNGLMARLFGVWTLLSGILRLYCAFHIKNLQVYNLTLVSFVLAFMHFMMEVVIYKTCSIHEIGVIAPLFISGVTTVWMTVGYNYLNETAGGHRKKNSRFNEDDMDFKKSLDSYIIKKSKTKGH